MDDSSALSWVWNHQNELMITTAIGLIALYTVQKQSNSQKIVNSVKKQCKDSIPSNSTIIVTGANTGIGYSSAKILAETGAEIILACRDQDRANEAMRSIQQSTGNRNVRVELLDLADISSIERFVSKIKQCHILINNAGIMQSKQELLHSKYDKLIATNYIGPWYLTQLLLPVLKTTSIKDNREVKVINVASRLEKHSPLRELYPQHGRGILSTVLKGTNGTYFSKAYATSKLGNILYTKELHQQLLRESSSLTASSPSARVSVNAVTPGVVNTELSRFLPGFIHWASYPIKALLLKSSDLGGAEIAYVASLQGESGKYFGERKVLHNLLEDSKYDDELARVLFEETKVHLQEMKENTSQVK